MTSSTLLGASTEALALHTSPIMTVGYFMQVLFSLAVVLGLIFVIAKYLLPKLRVATIGRVIQVVDRVMLEPQVTAYILKVGKRSWLVVASNKAVHSVAEVSGEILP
jgi:flagellar biogenesis protein FliO